MLVAQESSTGRSKVLGACVHVEDPEESPGSGLAQLRLLRPLESRPADGG